MKFSDVPKGMMILFLGFAAILLILAFAVYGIGGFLQSSADFRGETDKRNQVEASGGYKVAAHDWFYDQCSDIKSKQQELEIYKDGGLPEGKYKAMQTELIRDVEDYNAKASNSYTVGQFKADELPYQIEADEEVESCGRP
jgi:hypothetical protein